MSKPRQKRRYSAEEFESALLNERSLNWKAGILNTGIAEKFSQIVSGFEHIDAAMENFLALLLSSRLETGSAQCIYRTLRTPASRMEVVRNLLEKTALNARRGDEFDDLLKAYDNVRTKRNDLAHGLWWTDMEFRTYLSKPGFAEFPILNACEVKLTELQEILDAQVAFRDELNLVVIRPIERRKSHATKRRLRTFSSPQ